MERAFAGTAAAVADARRFVATVLEGCSRRDDAVVIVSELATSAVLRSSAPFTVTVRRGQPTRVEVRAATEIMPTADEAIEDDRLTRSLLLLSLLANDWGPLVESESYGVWVQLGETMPNHATCPSSKR